ncbi:hypothetical protein [Streptomyces sp. NPDC059802]|uniref:hypothetical protein n=1 Tax=Streptomyces sp. NPDC059802 TaxID=3346952 RepID=UPI00366517B7
MTGELGWQPGVEGGGILEQNTASTSGRATKTKPTEFYGRKTALPAHAWALCTGRPP